MLARYGCPPLRFTDPATGTRIKSSRRQVVRYEHAAPGDLVHVDVKKLGRIPDGGGHRVLGRAAGRRVKKPTKPGYAFLHHAVDDHSRLAYSEVLSDERKETAAACWGRARDWFAGCGITVRAVLTDNGSAYGSHLFAPALGEQVRHRRTRPYRPQTNGKVCEDLARRCTGRSDPGQGVTTVSCVRFVDRLRCSVAARTGQTDLT